MSRPHCVLASSFVLLVAVLPAAGQYKQAQLPLKHLPQEHAYQRDLREFLGSLEAKDFALEPREFTIAAPDQPEEQFRLWLLTLNLPAVGAAALPPDAFLLSSLESQEGLALPATPAECQMLAWLAHWDHPGNPHRGSRALKLRALALAIVDLVMLDYLYEHDPQGADRADFLGGNLIWIGYTSKCCRDVLPEKARAALDAGLKKHVERISQWGPRGAMTDMDLFAAVGVRYVADAVGGAEINQRAEAYARRLFTEERFFHPAGYFVDVGCFDTSYNGISLYFATWAALASDWPFARDAVDRAHRLRAHLCLPDPDGTLFGPSHMSSRTSADPPRDQWNFPQRPQAAAMVTDEALPLASLPAPAALAAAPARVAAHFNDLLGKPRQVQLSPWKEMHWSGAFNFAYEHYRAGYYPRRLQLEREGSPLAKPLYERNDRFVRQFDNALVVARYDDFAAVLHTGPIRGWPHGFGGGQLSAFWTPAAGSTVVGRRRGMQGSVVDSLDEWRMWPVHALSGVTADGELVTSTAITEPRLQSQIADNTADVVVSGAIPTKEGHPAPDYERRFLLKPSGLSIRTTLKAAAPIKFGELYETLPLLLHEASRVKEAQVKIDLQIADRWVPATVEPQAKVSAVRVERFGGAMVLTFDRPRVVRLSPRDWTDGFQTQATCRTLLIDLLDGGGSQSIESAAIEYTLSAAPKP